MWTKPENPVPIDNLQLRLGVFVWIDRSWKEHPFFNNKFRITTQEQLAQLQALGSDRIYWVPSKSTAEPLPATGDEAPPPIPASKELQQAAYKQKNDEVQRQRDQLVRAERAWEKAAKETTEALLGMRDNPKQAGSKMRELSSATTKSILGGEALLHLLGGKEGQGPQHHALNCMTLSMLIGKALKVPLTAVNEIALGALAHDAGKSMIPKHILRTKTRNKVEENLFRDHCKLGVELATISGAFSEGAISAIRDHHEALDGSGYPAGKKADEIGLAARIVAVANRYDRLCSPESPDVEPMLPARALRYMWKNEQTRLNPVVMTALIRLLGIYPPGTIVSLNDGSLGLVVSPGKNSLYPKVLIYNPEVAKDEAIVMDLQEGGGLAIVEAHHPQDIPEDVLIWMDVRKRITYYFTVEENA